MAKRKLKTTGMHSEPSTSGQADAPASDLSSSSDHEEAFHQPHDVPAATPRKSNTFRNLMAQFHGCRNLTPRKLALITNAPDPDEEIVERTARMIEEESTTDEEQEQERVRPPRRKASKKTPVEESIGSSISDISPIETGSEYAPSEVEGTRDFSGFEEVSDQELQQLVMEEEGGEPSSDDDPDDFPIAGPSTSRVMSRGRAQGERGR